MMIMVTSASSSQSFMLFIIIIHALHHHHSCSSSSLWPLRTLHNLTLRGHVCPFGFISYMCNLSDSSISCLFRYFVLLRLNSRCFRIEGNSFARINLQYFQGFAVKLQLNSFLHESAFQSFKVKGFESSRYPVLVIYTRRV